MCIRDSVAAGFGSAAQQGSNPAILNPVGTAATPGYNVGQGMVTGDSENLGSGANDHFNQMAFSIEKVTVLRNPEH